eukprot:14188407-Alexandrium_andersonii.AAC.1
MAFAQQAAGRQRLLGTPPTAFLRRWQGAISQICARAVTKAAETAEVKGAAHFDRYKQPHFAA